MLRSILFAFGWIRVQVLIDASFDCVVILVGFGFKFLSMLPSILCSFRLDVGSELVPFWLYFGSSSEPFQFHVGSILASLGVHFESIWGLWRGPVEEKLPSRIEGRPGNRAPPHFKRFWTHFKRFWAQKEATRRPKIGEKLMKNRCKNQ